jgi:D-alanyl-D-alanine carboxypeptidase (penicillin-binding protein 5/6)
LSAHLIREYPDYYHYFAIPEFTWSEIRQPNRNQLLFRNVGVDGLKTGHTDAGGYGIVVSAERDGWRLISAVNGLGSEAERNTEAGRLLDVGFREFKSYELLAANETVASVEIWGGAQDAVPVVAIEPLQTILSPDARTQMRVTVSYDGPVRAPITAGQQIAMLTLSAPGKPDRSMPLYAGQAVEEAGFFKNIYLGVSALVGGSGG